MDNINYDQEIEQMYHPENFETVHEDKLEDWFLEQIITNTYLEDFPTYDGLHEYLMDTLKGRSLRTILLAENAIICKTFRREVKDL